MARDGLSGGGVRMNDADFFIISALGLVTIAMAVIAIIQTNLIRAIAAYAICSICLAMLFFYLSSPFAGGS